MPQADEIRKPTAGPPGDKMPFRQEERGSGQVDTSEKVKRLQIKFRFPGRPSKSVLRNVSAGMAKHDRLLTRSRDHAIRSYTISRNDLLTSVWGPLEMLQLDATFLQRGLAVAWQECINGSSK